MVTTYLQDPSVRGPHPDGTYTIPDPADWPDNERGEWTIRDTGLWWAVTHSRGFDDAMGEFASAEGAARAVLGPCGRIQLEREDRALLALAVTDEEWARLRAAL